MDFFESASKIFKIDEGERNTPYRDSQGYWTIGRGHLIGQFISDLKLSPHIIEEIFKEDLDRAVREAELVVGSTFFDSMAPARQLALVSMLYTLGRTKFLKFEPTIEAIKRNDWDEVAYRIMQSKWARDVDPQQRENVGRDDRIAYMFKTGKFHCDYGINL